MKTLIIPCAGKSSRFPNMKPKYLLTHPDGKLMIEKSLEGMPLRNIDRIIITIVKEHSEKYEAALILRQIFGKNKKIEIFELENFTSCQAETIYKTLQSKKVSGAFIVKDSDNAVEIKLNRNENFVGSLHIPSFPTEIRRLSAKSFLSINEHGIVTDIVEKKISSEYICVGVYGFATATQFNESYESLVSNKRQGEIYISHVIGQLIATNTSIFTHSEVKSFEDWGTLQDWRITQLRHSTYFVDIDGVLMKNTGKYGSSNWSNANEELELNLNLLKKLQDDGAQIVLTTSRGNNDLGQVKIILKKYGVKPHQIVANCHHAPRVIINDYAPTNPYPCTEAINMPRNGNLPDFIKLSL